MRASLGGSVRRMRETVADVDIIASAPDAAPVFAHFLKFPQVAESMGAGESKASVRLKETDLQVDLRVLPDEDFASALHHFTGSQGAPHPPARPRHGEGPHHLGVGRLPHGRRRGRPEEGHRQARGRRREAAHQGREGPLRAAGHAVRAPGAARRLGRDRSRAGPHPARGSDHRRRHQGQRARAHHLERRPRHPARPWPWPPRPSATSTSPSPSTRRPPTTPAGCPSIASRPSGTKSTRCRKRCKGITLLKGIESDILEDGSLDYPDSVLEQLDVVIGSIHQRYSQDEDAMTRRVLNAFDNPHLHIWGHPTGRLLLKREAGAHAHGRDPRQGGEEGHRHRGQRLPRSHGSAPARTCARPSQRGLKLVVSTDAHSVSELKITPALRGRHGPPGLGTQGRRAQHARREGLPRGLVAAPLTFSRPRPRPVVYSRPQQR